jgi:hypothetical protein
VEWVSSLKQLLKDVLETKFNQFGVPAKSLRGK